MIESNIIHIHKAKNHKKIAFVTTIVTILFFISILIAALSITRSEREIASTTSNEAVLGEESSVLDIGH